MLDGVARRFGNLSLDAPGLADGDGGSVTIATGVLTLGDSSSAATSCALVGGCGAGLLNISASQIAFSSGAVSAQGFGGGVTLAASNGVVFDGAASFDAGDASMAVLTPFLGDRGTGVPGATLPRTSP